MNDPYSEAAVECLDFKKFPKPLANGAIGMFFGKITHGVTCNFFSDLYFSNDLNERQIPVLSAMRAIRSIKYSMASEILVAVQYLQGFGWFEEKVEFSIEGLEPFDEVVVRGWDEDWALPEQVDFAYYLEDVCTELELRGDVFGKEWFYSKVAHLYFLNGDERDTAMNIGVLLNQLWVKDALETSALRGAAQEESLVKANQVRKERTIAVNRERNDVVAKFWNECLAEHGQEVMRRDANAAQAIHILAIARRPRELTIRASGEIIGVEAIRKRLASLRKLGKIGSFGENYQNGKS